MSVRLKMDFDALSELSKLEFDDEERSVIEAELEDLVGFLGQVSEAETGAFDDSLSKAKNVFRYDNIACSQFTLEEMLSNAKTKADGYITVPRVVGEEND